MRNNVKDKKMEKSLSAQKGFTLIELIAAFSIIAILTTMSIASFNSFNSNQKFEAAASDVISMLNTAKSRSISQVKPDICKSDEPLNGYQVRVSGTEYMLSVICDDQEKYPPLETKKLPSQMNFDVEVTIMFDRQTGSASENGTVKIRGFGKSRDITTEPSGNVSVRQYER